MVSSAGKDTGEEEEEETTVPDAELPAFDSFSLSLSPISESPDWETLLTDPLLSLLPAVAPVAALAVVDAAPVASSGWSSLQ